MAIKPLGVELVPWRAFPSTFLLVCLTIRSDCEVNSALKLFSEVE